MGLFCEFGNRMNFDNFKKSFIIYHKHFCCTLPSQKFNGSLQSKIQHCREKCLWEIFFFQVVDLAKNITKTNNTKEAVRKFKKIVKSSKHNYNDKPFPANESDDDAHDRCDNDEGS